jgi:hypothetical protein
MISARTDAGKVAAAVNNTGPPNCDTTGPALKASGKFSPDATNNTGTPEPIFAVGKAACEIDTDVE